MSIKSFLSHRKFIWLVTLLAVVLWMGIGSVGGPTFGKLSDVADNNQANYLPPKADSTKVINLESNFLNTKSFPAVLIITSNNKFTPNDISKLGGLNSDLAKIQGVSTSPKA